MLRLGIRLEDNGFVVAQYDGQPIQPRSLTHEWVRLIGKTSLPRIRFHDLRHTHASQMLAAGVHPKVASERLGIPPSALRLIFIRMSCQECRQTLQNWLTLRSGAR